MATSERLRESIGTFQFGEFELDTERFELRRDGVPIIVQPQVLETLAYLLAHRDRVVSKDELMEGPWRGTVVSEGAISQVIFLIRKALADDVATQRFVKTVRGRGFRFVGDARFVQLHAAAAIEPTPAAPRASVPEARRFVGRTEEVDTLLAQFAAAAGGRGSALFVVGEPGIGKTRLMEETALLCHGRGGRVHWGRCREAGGTSPFEPWAQLVASIAGGVREGLLAIAAELHPMFPDLASESAPVHATGEGSAARLRLFEEVVALLRRAADEAPTLLVLEDLHAIDEPSLLLLEFVAQRLGDSRLLVVATLRDPATSPTLETTLATRFADATRLALSGLHYDEVAALAPILFGGQLPPGVLRSLFERSSGNPFLIDELVRQLVLASGRDATTRALETFRLPEGLAEAVRRGLATLPKATRSLLATAAVIGRDFDLVLLRQTVELDAASVLAHLGPAVSRRFVRETGLGRFIFSHSLVREALYEELSPAERASQHARVGAALETIYPAAPPVTELAHHYMQAAPAGAVDKAIHYQRAAGIAANQRLAYEEAALHVSRALEVLALGAPDEELRIDLLLDLGRASYLGGHGARALESFVTAMERARARKDAMRFARAVDGYAAAQKHVFDFRLMGWLQEAVTTFPTIESPLGARLLARFAHAIRFTPDPSRSHELARRAVEIARQHDDTGTLAVALNALRWGLREHVSPEDRLRLSLETVATSLAAGDRSLACEARVLVMMDLLELGRRAEMEVELARFTDEAKALREPLHDVTAERLRVVVAMLDGRFVEADAQAEAVLAAGRRIGDQTAELAYWIEMSMIRREQGRFAELEPFCRAMSRLVPQGTAWPCVLCLVLAEIGKTDEAMELLAKYTDDPDVIPVDVNYWVTLSDLAEACSILDDRERAPVLYDRYVPHRPYHVVVPGCSLYMGPSEHYLGMLAATMGRIDLAIEHFEAAIAACMTVGAGAWKVRAELECARARFTRGKAEDRERGELHLRTAIATAERSGMSGVLARLQALSAEIGLQN
jgi:DNA-binding winged helix-turn-helix (wHTH) protein/tetratricopeptide (TPR) repeat protein